MTRDMKTVFRMCCFIWALAIGAGCSEKHPTSRSFVVGGNTGVLYVAKSNTEQMDPAISTVTKSISSTMGALDERNPYGELAKLNRLGGSARLPISRIVFRALDMGRAYGELTGGAYDYTMGGVAGLWIRGEPDAAVLAEAINHSGIKYVEAADNGSIALTLPGVKITPGPLAFAYALDVGITEVRRTISGPFLIQYGSFIRMGRSIPEKQAPKIPVPLQQHETIKTLGHVQLTDFPSMASLHRPQLLIDPRTGRPTGGTRLAVVIGPLCTKAYALAEALLVLGLEDGKKIMANFPGYEVLLVPDENPVACWMTEGFRRNFTAADEAADSVHIWDVANPSAVSDSGL